MDGNGGDIDNVPGTLINNNSTNGNTKSTIMDDRSCIDTNNNNSNNNSIMTNDNINSSNAVRRLPPPPPLSQNVNVNVDVVQNNETILLHFVDGKQLFAYCSMNDKRKSVVRIQKRNYTTSHCVGLPYGTVLELQSSSTLPHNHNNSAQLQLVPLPPSEKLIPDLILPTTSSSSTTAMELDGEKEGEDKIDAELAPSKGTTNTTTSTATSSTTIKTKDNRHLVDTNTAQSMDYPELLRMRLQGCRGDEIITSLLEHSKTYDTKTTFAQEKYILRKQMKHQIRCRIVQCNAATIMEALYKKDSKKYMNIRDDTLGQILSYSNICSGCQTLVYDDNYGIILSAICERMNGYGIIYAIYEQQQPSYMEMFQKFNLSFEQINCIQYIHTGDLFHDTNDATTATTTTTAAVTAEVDEIDYERIERERLQWPCVLQDHTRQYLVTQTSQPSNVRNFLIKRASRFARKLCRTTNIEAKQSLMLPPPASSTASLPNDNTTNSTTATTTMTHRLCDSLVLVTKYDPTTTLLQLFPHLAPSSPYVIYCEYIEPLTECFKQIQTNPALLSINLRLSDTWMREYQILPNRTHPAMSMSQSGGFILTGIKLHPIYGSNEFNEEQLKEIREEIGGGRRARSNRKKPTSSTSTSTMTSGTTTNRTTNQMEMDVTTTNDKSKKRKNPP